METKKTLKITDESGNVKEYEILCAFKWTKTDKYYVIYTDNKKDEEGSLLVSAAIYDPTDNTKLENIETEEERREIEKRLTELMN